jgi:hypothetical protein
MNLQFLVRQRGRLAEKSPRACADAWKEAHVLCSAIYPGAHIFRVRPPIPDILYLSPAAAACAPVRAIRSPRPHACHRKMTEIFPISGIYTDAQNSLRLVTSYVGLPMRILLDGPSPLKP